MATNGTSTDLPTLLAYAFLYLTVIALWLPSARKSPIWYQRYHRQLWYIPLGFALIFGAISQILSLPSLISIVPLALATLAMRQKHWPKAAHVLAALVLLALGIGLGAHLLPGFQNLKVLDQAQISHDGLPFSLYLNFDKTLLGIFILGGMHPLISTQGEWLKMLKLLLPRIPLLIAALACLAAVLGYVRIDLKLPDSLLLWASTNLLFVCVAEEAFFRGLIQRYLAERLQAVNYGQALALLTASLLFGLAHIQGGWTYVLLASVSGVAYGWMYMLTKRIEASILAHFLLNLSHFLLLTYPAIKPS